MSQRYLILSTSLRPNSRSYILAKEAAVRLKAQGIEAELVDLREHPLPLCPVSGTSAQERTAPRCACAASR